MEKGRVATRRMKKGKYRTCRRRTTSEEKMEEGILANRRGEEDVESGGIGRDIDEIEKRMTK